MHWFFRNVGVANYMSRNEVTGIRVFVSFAYIFYKAQKYVSLIMSS